MENSLELPQKNKNKAAIWSSNFTNEYFPKKSKKLIWKDIYLHTNIHCSIIYNSQVMDAP